MPIKKWERPYPFSFSNEFRVTNYEYLDLNKIAASCLYGCYSVPLDGEGVNWWFIYNRYLASPVLLFQALHLTGVCKLSYKHEAMTDYDN